MSSYGKVLLGMVHGFERDLAFVMAYKSAEAFGAGRHKSERYPAMH